MGECAAFGAQPAPGGVPRRAAVIAARIDQQIKRQQPGQQVVPHKGIAVVIADDLPGRAAAVQLTQQAE